ncbi:MAG: hypothetical protein BGO59_30960 [Spirosoma sp. 48-14]|nr:MAG: hypothetical protein BGO59_30960 [Spirosoma sp. 48-14]
MATLLYDSNQLVPKGKAKHRTFFPDGSSIDFVEVKNNVTKANLRHYHKFFTGQYSSLFN